MHVFSIQETAGILGRHPETIRRMIRRGELSGKLRRGGGWVTSASIERLLGERLDGPLLEPTEKIPGAVRTASIGPEGDL